MFGLVGKPNVGKTLIFNAWCHSTAKVSNYPFCTIDPNKGSCWLPVRCPCSDFGKECGHCDAGLRRCPVQMLDIAGIVAGAAEGTGMGHRFLSEILAQPVLLIVIDATGALNSAGEPRETPSLEQVYMDLEQVENEIARWIAHLLERRTIKHLHQLVKFYENFGIKEDRIRRVFIEQHNNKHFFEISMIKELIAENKPIIYILNKIDQVDHGSFEQLCTHLARTGKKWYPYSALLDHGRSNPRYHDQCVERMRNLALPTGGEILSRIIFDELRMKIVFPVKNLPELTDQEGRILPDIVLLPDRSTCLDLAYKIHQDLGDHFIRGIDARTHKILSSTSLLQQNDVIRIVAKG